VYAWLERTNPSDIHDRARRLYAEGTNIWILQSEEWRRWVRQQDQFIWIHGIPGAGKTLLLSHLYETLNLQLPARTSVETVYYYCYFGHNQDETLPLLQWLVSQLCRRATLVPQQLLSHFKTGRNATLSLLENALEELLGYFDIVYLFVDALDESSEPRSHLLDLFKRLTQEARFQNIQLLATSREYLDIEKSLSPICVPLSIPVNQVEADVRKYVFTTLSSDYKFSKWPDLLRREVEDALAVGAKGMSDQILVPPQKLFAD